MKDPAWAILVALLIIPFRLSESSAEREIGRVINAYAAQTALECGEARHLFTHIEWRMRGFQIELPEALPDFVWEDAETIRASYSFPTALKYYLKRL